MPTVYTYLLCIYVIYTHIAVAYIEYTRNFCEMITRSPGSSRLFILVANHHRCQYKMHGEPTLEALGRRDGLATCSGSRWDIQGISNSRPDETRPDAAMPCMPPWIVLDRCGHGLQATLRRVAPLQESEMTYHDLWVISDHREKYETFIEASMRTSNFRR